MAIFQSNETRIVENASLWTAKYVWVYEEHINIYEGKGQKIGFDVNMQDIEVHKWNMLSMKNAK